MGTNSGQPKRDPTEGTTQLKAGRDNPTDRMLRRRIVEVPPEWLKPRKSDGRTLQKAKRRLAATLGERVIEKQAQRAERTQQDNQ